MDSMWEQVFPRLGDPVHLTRVTVRLFAAVILGAIIGFERQHEGKQAGMRTHMLVALGAALFALVPLEGEVKMSDLSRVIQGVAAGIGFLGAGTILQLNEEHKVKGLTTAASIWLTAAVGLAVGVGYLWPALLSVILGWMILSTVHHIEYWLRHRQDPQGVSEGPTRGEGR